MPLTTARPMRLLLSLTFRIRATQPQSLVADIVERQAAAEQRAVAHIANVAEKVEHGLQTLATEWRAAMADGELDASESRRIAEHILATQAQAHRTTTQARHLAT